MKTKTKFFSVILLLGVAYGGISLVLSKKSEAGPLASMPAWCTPGVPNANSTHCAGNTITLTDGGGNWQSRWMGQYAVRTAGASQWWLTYCLRDDLSHPNVTADGTIVPTLIDINGNPVTLNPKYSYVTWKWGDTSDNNTASAVWMLGHYYAQDVTGSGNVIVPDLNASNDAAVNALAQAMDAEAASMVAPWSVQFNLSTPGGWNGSSDTGLLTVLSNSGNPIPNAVVSLSATGGAVTPSSVTTDASGQATFSYSSSGGTVTVNGSVNGPGNYVVIDPPGGADQLVGTSGGDTLFSGSANATPDPRYAVGDYVWIDANRDGIQDGSEQAVPNVTVELLQNCTTVIASTTTDTNGHYVFDNLPAGDYCVQFSNTPTNYIFTTQNDPDGTAATNSNPNNSGLTPQFTIGPAAPDMRAPIPSDGTSVAVMINPTIDAGIVLKQIDLSIVKTLQTTGPYTKGQQLVYKIVAHNNGPDDAVAGWSVTDLLPDGLLFSSPLVATGSDPSFTCGSITTITGGNSVTCSSSSTLANGESKDLFINVTISDSVGSNVSLRNLAYISPSVNETVETIVLAVPTFSTGATNQTTTNNDTEAVLSLATSIPGVPNTGTDNTVATAKKLIIPAGLTVFALAVPMSLVVFYRKR